MVEMSFYEICYVCIIIICKLIICLPLLADNYCDARGSKNKKVCFSYASRKRYKITAQSTAKLLLPIMNTKHDTTHY